MRRHLFCAFYLCAPFGFVEGVGLVTVGVVCGRDGGAVRA